MAKQTYRIQTRIFLPSSFRQSIIGMQSPQSRAITLGYIKKRQQTCVFIPGRLHFGALREQDTATATMQSLSLQQIKSILKGYKPQEISTVTILREAVACRLGQALCSLNIPEYYGDAFIGATHMKGKSGITTSYQYENTEGLVPHGLWIIADSICMGRNLKKTLDSLLKTFHPKEIIFICPLASRRGIETIGQITHAKQIKTTFIVWGGLFGVDERTLYDMPWGHPDSVPVDERDKETFTKMYNETLCVGGDFGNAYFSPMLAKALYEEQLAEQHITPRIPDSNQILQIYSPQEVIIR